MKAEKRKCANAQKWKRIKAIFVLTFTLFYFHAFTLPSQSYALSEYGRKCDENKECVECRDKSSQCNKCMNACWNLYGPAETNNEIESRDKEEICRIRRAKWCNAQCWDPDDKAKIDYKTTKPDCSTTTAFPNYQRTKRPW